MNPTVEAYTRYYYKRPELFLFFIQCIRKHCCHNFRSYVYKETWPSIAHGKEFDLYIDGTRCM